MKIKTSFATLLIIIVLLTPAITAKMVMVDNGTITKIAEPFRPIAVKLTENSKFPIYLPSYLPPLNRGEDWIIKPEINNNSFSIEIDQHEFGDRNGAGMYDGALFSNVGNPPESPLENQFVSEKTEVKSINLPNGITGKEYIMEQGADKGISWEVGQWSYFVATQPDSEVSSAKDYALQIIKTIGLNGLALSDSPGNLYFFYLNHTFTEIYWKVNDSVWYQLVWQHDPCEAIKILRSMNYMKIGIGEK
ncbi:hypothetical protein Desaci_0185 [Desulfosporosinus acidiphilus SJ4]|uniref:Uncharacterized protein n=1 Tax=Desulfosporosinus acidiphilus (strain DSM 22704 / JCM 16185 / SJ4) TaxID=646529 RepID=I4D0D8_DESAJ|nr:hypothetical protein [Desulfosporosinus acidiphilus]AFM39262.1 hypothetical protein Desaci_0185 [Desulfosporosinus acidiphilus SJ4]